MPDAYERICAYEMAIGVESWLENLATVTPSDFELRDGVVFRKKATKAARFFIVGCVTHPSALCTKSVYNKHSVNVMPSKIGWGRSSGVIHALLGDVTAYVFADGLSFSTMPKSNPAKIPSSYSPKKIAATSPSKPNIPVSGTRKVPVEWSKYAALPGDKPVPIYDARSLDFDIKNLHQLPAYQGELDAGMVIMVVFTLGRYSGMEGEKLSLNVQTAVALHDNVPEENRPSETIIDAKFPLPYN
ncbi:hypothetical protein R3P38DRAFT_3220283 [Favolaschia claudopus]|uniref:Uncharacterized protein n=1 Tax=Favolaschia claudopus TaxID=2862362 RepID=A0AAW0A285_9AGAR